MEEVCQADTAAASDKDACHRFAFGIASVMSGDEDYNRNDLDLAKFCNQYYDFAVIPMAAGIRGDRVVHDRIPANVSTTVAHESSATQDAPAASANWDDASGQKHAAP